MTESQHIQLAISQTFPCSYLASHQSTLLLCTDHHENLPLESLLMLGFRRSGDQVYRPHCHKCQACQAVRIPVADFIPSRSQRRIINKNKDIRWIISEEDKPVYRALYQRYIQARHQDGPMYPPSDNQFEQFLLSRHWPILFLEGWLNDELVAVAVTDLLPHSLSATYTFFAPEFAQRSLGKQAIIAQIELAKQSQRQFLYLGYYIAQCHKMAYKNQFQPLEIYRHSQWQRVDGNTFT